MKCPREHARAQRLRQQANALLDARPFVEAGRDAAINAEHLARWAEHLSDCASARRHLQRAKALLGAARRFAKRNQTVEQRRPQRRMNELRWT